MPFKSTDSGIPIWEDPEEAIVESFEGQLLQDGASGGEVTLPNVIQKQLHGFMQSTLKGARRLAESNKTRAKSLAQISKKGILPVDIIVPVFNNFQVVEECINSIYKHTDWPFNLTVVDDKSTDPWIKPHLITLLNEKENARILWNNKNKGFAATVNRGINNSKNPYICVLNSDVIVTKGWLSKMVLALEADPKNKIVNPMTNNTALINVNMQEGFSYQDMNRGFEATSSHKYPEIMPTGFCFMLERELLDEIGQFDEGYENYGEETDLWMKTITHIKNGEYPRWRAVLADDVYLFHERGTSFSSLGQAKHNAKRQSGSARFHQLWPQYRHWGKSFDAEKIMSPYRANLPTDVSTTDSPYNIAFVVYSTAFCGGMKFITDIVNQHIENGVNAKVVLIKRNPEESVIPVLGELRASPIVFNSIEEFEEKFIERVFEKGVVVAATCEIVKPIFELTKKNFHLRSVLFAQSDDPELCPEEMKQGMIDAFSKVQYVIAGSESLNKKIQEEYKVNTLGFVRPGVDKRLFHTRSRDNGDERPTVLFSLQTQYPFKGYTRGVEVAKKLSALGKEHQKELRIMAYGVDAVSECPSIIGLGNVSQSYLASLLSTEVDIFCDPAIIHSYGMPSLEAMVSGAAVVSWDNRGIREYANEDNSRILPNNTPPEEVAIEIFDLLFNNPEKLQQLKNSAPQVNQMREDAVNQFNNLLEKKLRLLIRPRKISVITPHLRKHGGPTTIIHLANGLQRRGHDVDLYTIYPDINPEVVNLSEVPINLNWRKIKKSHILISNSDNDQNEFFTGLKSARKKIMLKLSHNKRFQSLEDNGLKLPWDAIVTSTNWLKDACENPMVGDGWTHPAREATRIGWFHYGHEIFNCPPNMRQYGSINSTVRIGFLAHQHPLKGTGDAMKVVEALKMAYKDKVEIVAIGEWPDFAKMKPKWMGYVISPNREQMANTMHKIDIWLSASHTEGLGRIVLEAMSASTAVITTNTGAEFVEAGKNCLEVNIGNIAQMVKAADKLIKNPQLFSEIVKNGYETACRYADPDPYLDALEEVIDNV